MTCLLTLIDFLGQRDIPELLKGDTLAQRLPANVRIIDIMLILLYALNVGGKCQQIDRNWCRYTIFLNLYQRPQVFLAKDRHRV